VGLVRALVPLVENGEAWEGEKYYRFLFAFFVLFVYADFATLEVA
jgi:hypothetical protein